MPLLSTEAIVLSSLRLGEEDKLITFFSLSRGKISGVAKGARRFKNRFGASLEPFTHCHLVLFEKPNNKLARISQADILYSFRKLREAWEPIERGTEMVRLLLRITPEEQPHPNLYNLIKEALALLEIGSDRHLSTILFMAFLVAESGYQPRWDQCVRCNRPAGSAITTRHFSHKQGGVLCPQCSGDAPLSISQDAWAFLYAISKMDFRSAHEKSPSLLIKREVETLLKDYILCIIGKRERPLSI